MKPFSNWRAMKIFMVLSKRLHSCWLLIFKLVSIIIIILLYNKLTVVPGFNLDESNHFDEIGEIVKKVEEGTIGFEVDVTEFHSLCPLETLSAPHTDARKLIYSVLGIFSDVVKQQLSNENNGSNIAVHGSDEDVSIPLLPDYIPYTKQQWDEALERLPNTDPSQLSTLFNFTSNKASPVKASIRLNLLPLSDIEDVSMAHIWRH